MFEKLQWNITYFRNCSIQPKRCNDCIYTFLYILSSGILLLYVCISRMTIGTSAYGCKESCPQTVLGYMQGKCREWNLDGCKMSYYTTSDIRGCLERSRNSSDRSNYFMFVGDSRVRELCHSFNRIVSGGSYRVANDRMFSHYAFKFNNQLFTSEFIWSSQLDRKVFDRLVALKPEHRPKFVVIGTGPWYLKNTVYHFKNGLHLFREHLTGLLPIFDVLYNTTKLIWNIQAHFFMNVSYDRGLCRKPIEVWEPAGNYSCRHPWMRKELLDSINREAMQLLKNTSVYIWTSYRYLHHAYAFEMLDGMHLIPGHLAPSSYTQSLGLNTITQKLINFHCHQYFANEQGASPTSNATE